MEAELAKRPSVSGPGVAPGEIRATQRLARLLDSAEREATRLKDEYVSVEHLVIAFLGEADTSAKRASSPSRGSHETDFSSH